MKAICGTKLSSSSKNAASKRLRDARGFTMFEVLIVVIALGLLAALAIPTIDRFRDANADTVKTQNARLLSQYMETLHNAGVDTTGWTDGATAITALRTGVQLPETVPGGARPTVRLAVAVNPNAYTFTAATAARPGTFAPILGVATERP